MSDPAPPFAPPADRRNALDRAHIGDIEGALGTVHAFDTGPRLTLRRKLGTLLAVIGPGIVVMVADNDAGTISVFSQAGQNHGMRLLWVLIALCPAAVHHPRDGRQARCRYRLGSRAADA